MRPSGSSGGCTGTASRGMEPNGMDTPATPEATEIKIRGYHLDLYGHVNNARYLEFLEEARWELFENHVDLKRWKKRNLGFFVVSITIDYRRPASLGDVLCIETYLSRFGEKSAVFTQKISRKKTGERIADAGITFVLADLKTGRAVVLDRELKAVLEPFCKERGCAEAIAGHASSGA
jgi:thioesterase-3